MEEEPGWPGLWRCPDNKVRLNDAPPFRWKCNGKEITEEAVEAFEDAYAKLIAERN